MAQRHARFWTRFVAFAALPHAQWSFPRAFLASASSGGTAFNAGRGVATSPIIRATCTPLLSRTYLQTGRRGMSHGICFSPFPRNELEILEFNLRQQIKQRRMQFEKHVARLIEDMREGKVPKTIDEQIVLEQLEQDMKRKLTSREQRELKAELMKAFDPVRYKQWVRDEEVLLSTAVSNAVQHIRKMQAGSTERVVMTRNKAALILSTYLNRYPDREEVERLWDQRFKLPSVEWDEGGDFTRSSTVGSEVGFGQSGNDCL